MTSENYRQLLNTERDSLEMTKEDFDNTLMHFAKLYHKEQLDLSGVSKSIALGKTVKVNRCIYGHEFNLGETVEIIDYEPSQTASWLCSNGKSQWWLSEDEANVC